MGTEPQDKIYIMLYLGREKAGGQDWVAQGSLEIWVIWRVEEQGGG